MLDTTKQFYVRLHQSDLGIAISHNRFVSKQNFPLQVSHCTSECEAQLLQPIRTVPKSYIKRILVLRETLWIPLRDNSWISIAPVTYHITVICPDQEPSQI
jgi:hypothetical protein